MAAPRRLPLPARWRRTRGLEPPRPSWPNLSERDCPQDVEPEGALQATPLEPSRLTLRPGA